MEINIYIHEMELIVYYREQHPRRVGNTVRMTRKVIMTLVKRMMIGDDTKTNLVMVIIVIVIM